jgi:hypothetical protein
MARTKAHYSIEQRAATMEVICERVAMGECLAGITEDPKMPGYTTVSRWMAEDETGELRANYGRAREARADRQADEIVALADTATERYHEVEDENGEIMNERMEPSDALNQTRLQIDARKWHAGRMKPRTWGDRQQVDAEHHVVGKITVDFRE